MRRLAAALGLGVAGLMGGLSAAPAQTSQCVASAIAGGTADALTIPQLPCTPTTSLLTLTFSQTNTTTSPTLQALGQGPAKPLIYADGSSVSIGALGAGHSVLVTFNGTSWLILTIPSAAGSGITQLTGDGTAGPGSGAQALTVTKVNGNTQVAFLNIQDQTLSGGANITSATQTTGNITIDCGKNPAQYISNSGGFTITAPSLDGYCYLDVENAFGAGTVSLSGFSPNTIGGAALDTTNGHNFRLYVSRVHGHATIDAKALQ